MEVPRADPQPRSNSVSSTVPPYGVDSVKKERGGAGRNISGGPERRVLIID